jgi:hypothetical protein
MEQPTDVGGKLLRFRPRQEHAVIEGMQETLFPDPSLLFHQDTMHDGDLTRRSAET